MKVAKIWIKEAEEIMKSVMTNKLVLMLQKKIDVLEQENERLRKENEEFKQLSVELSNLRDIILDKVSVNG